MSLLLALAFLTVIPVGRLMRGGGRVPAGAPMTTARRGGSPGRALRRAMLWFPAVGLAIGSLTCAVLLGAVRLLPGTLPEIAAVAFLVGLTGALHLDGLADAFDGLFGGHDRESRLRIMRDPGVGAYGVAAVVLALLLRVGILSALVDARWLARAWTLVGPHWWRVGLGPNRWAQAAVVVLMPVWGRWVMTLAAGVGPYARREGGTGAAFVEGMSVPEALVLGFIPFGLTGYLLEGAGLLAGAATAAVVLGILFWWRAKLGGVTGDTMGALGELAEILFALLVLVLLPVGRPGPAY